MLVYSRIAPILPRCRLQHLSSCPTLRAQRHRSPLFTASLCAQLHRSPPAARCRYPTYIVARSAIGPPSSVRPLLSLKHVCRWFSHVSHARLCTAPPATFDGCTCLIAWRHQSRGRREYTYETYQHELKADLA
jgi:hypothetical protein